ncbi:MAG: APC family permease [Nocardioides sp.]
MSEPSGDSATGTVGEAGPGEKGLKEGAIGFWDGLAIGLDSTAPAYSLAAVLGSMVVIAGVKAPAVLLVSFVPMFLIAGAFYYMNRADQDCGTTFSWVTRAMGPWVGWMGGWAVFTTGVIVVGAQSDVAAYYIFDLLGMDTARDTFGIRAILAITLTMIMTYICVAGTELSAKVQRVMVLAQIGALALFVVMAIVAVARGLGEGADFSLSWLSPVGLSGTALISGMLLGVFMYWGWESAVNLTEESTDSETTPGRAAVTSTVILLATYVGVAISIVAVASQTTIKEFDDDAGLFGAVAEDVMGPLAPLLVLSIVISCLASSQTTILPASRTSLSMATAKAFPSTFSEVHPVFGTPAKGTWFIGIVSSIWYVVTSSISDNFLYDSLSALSIVVAFYYALTGLACTIYWRNELGRSVKSALMVGVGPLVGSITLFVLLFFAARDSADPDKSYTGNSVLGIGLPMAIALFLFVLGVALMFARFLSGNGHTYFTRKGFEQVSDEVAEAALGPIQLGDPTKG